MWNVTMVHENESHPPLAKELCYLLNGLGKKARLTVLACPGILVLKNPSALPVIPTSAQWATGKEEIL